MQARKIIFSLALAGTAFGAGVFVTQRWLPAPPSAETALNQDEHAGVVTPAGKTWYTCGMHPEVVQDHAGTCPKCGMKLQPMGHDRAVAMGLEKPGADDAAGKKKNRKIVYWKSSMIPGEIHEEAGKDSMGMDLIPVYSDELAAGTTIRIDPVTEQNMGVRIATITRAPLIRTTRSVGYVEYDETTLAAVTTKVDGWVEKLYVDRTGEQVHKGDPLFELYSPELFSAQEEYLATLRNLSEKGSTIVPRARLDSHGLLRDARQRLRYFDISPAQIRELEKRGKVRKTLTIRAPFTGILTHKNIVEGQHIKAGADILRIADLSTVWVIGKLFEQDLPLVHLGQETFMTLSYLPGKTFVGRVTYIYPYLETHTREASVRIEFHNPGYELKPGMYAKVSFTSRVADEAILVPDMAVIYTGLRTLVFIMSKPGRYEPRNVKLGVRGDGDQIQVLSGLSPGETVVISGQFLLDSESRLREAALKFTKSGKTTVKAATKSDSPSKELAHAGHQHGELAYVCPMPEHAGILYDKAGNCPICGMKLVPVIKDAGHVEAPAIDHWTCPMPEHATLVHESGPGKCPICGMTLIPVPAAEPQHSHSPDPQSAARKPQVIKDASHVDAPAIDHWTCPMPEHAALVHESGPGACPICGMALIPVPASEPQHSHSPDPQSAARKPQ